MGKTDFDKELLRTNLLGATTLKQLHEKEKIVTNAKMIALHGNPIEGDLDYAHLKKIHLFLFEDVYTWAGKDRYETEIKAVFSKGSTLFTPYERLPEVSKTLFDSLKNENYFRGQNKEAFAKSAAIFMNGLNILHPFREGNGRVQRIFMEYVAQNAGFALSFNTISEQEMILASIEGAKGQTIRLEKIFRYSLAATKELP